MKIHVLFFSLSSVIAFPTSACTVWGAVGDGVTENGDVMVFKVRDEKPNSQCLVTVNDGNGYAFRGIFVGKNKTFNMGINAKGLFVGRTTAGSVPKDIRNVNKNWRGPNRMYSPEFYMRYCDSVEQALTHTEIFTSKHPVNVIMADRNEIAILECYVDGTYKVQRVKKGVVTHTNHYIFEGSKKYNIACGESSLSRYTRITELVNKSVKPLSFKKFVSFSQDRHNSLDNSIFRYGSDIKRSHTISMAAARIPKIGTPELYFNYLADPSDRKNPWIEIWEKSALKP